MGFWHRNVDYHQIIFSILGALRWETEIGTVTLNAGKMILIPKGIAHRSMLCDASADENVLLELKMAEEISYVGAGSREEIRRRNKVATPIGEWGPPGRLTTLPRLVAKPIKTKTIR